MEQSVIDLIIRIKNGYMAQRETVDSPYSTFKEEVLKKLVSLKFIKEYNIEGEGIKTLNMTLLYHDKAPALTDVAIFSKPGRRYYVSYKELRPVLSGMGHSIISTSQGIKTGREAKKEKIGGELLFSLW